MELYKGETLSPREEERIKKYMRQKLEEIYEDGIWYHTGYYGKVILCDSKDLEKLLDEDKEVREK